MNYTVKTNAAHNFLCFTHQLVKIFSWAPTHCMVPELQNSQLGQCTLFLSILYDPCSKLTGIFHGVYVPCILHACKVTVT